MERSGHVSGELFKAMTGVKLEHVRFAATRPRPRPLLAGDVQVHFAGVIATIEHIKAGTLRALAVTTARDLDRCRMSRP
jgi:tripartite-type tricarboxylate transporter receptor subunit TctC